MADETKVLAASIVNFLNQQLEGGALRSDSKESLEVGVQCIKAAFELTDAQLALGVDLPQLLREPRDSTRAHAERLKNEGNEFMKAERYGDALERYSRAIAIDPRNAVYFCNRAAAQFKLGEHEAAVADCTAALALQPDYGKAHGRLGIALTALERHRAARAAFARAAQLEPDNESYRQNLRLADEKLAELGPAADAVDLGGLLHNPQLLTMASEMLSDPSMQNVITGLMGATNMADVLSAAGAVNGGGAAGGVAGEGSTVGGVGMEALLQAGQALAQHMQSVNPELVEQLRRQVRSPEPDGPPPPPSAK